MPSRVITIIIRITVGERVNKLPFINIHIRVSTKPKAQIVNLKLLSRILWAALYLSVNKFIKISNF